MTATNQQYAFLISICRKSTEKIPEDPWVWEGIFAKAPTKAMVKAAIEQCSSVNHQIWDLLPFIKDDWFEENGRHDIHCAGIRVGSFKRLAHRYFP